MLRSFILVFICFTSASAQNIATDPAVTGALTPQAFEPGGQFFPSGLNVRGTVIDSTRSGNVSVIGGPVIQIGPNLAIQQGMVSGQIGYTIDLTADHPTSVHSPFSNSASTSATIADSNQTRSINFNVQVNATLDHPANGYDGPQGDGFPPPSAFGAIDIYTINVQGQVEAVFRQGFGQSGGDQAPLGPGRPTFTPDNPLVTRDRSQASRPESVVFVDQNGQVGSQQLDIPFDPGSGIPGGDSGLFDTGLTFNPPGGSYDSEQLYVDVSNPIDRARDAFVQAEEDLIDWIATKDYLLDLGDTSFFEWVGRNRDELGFARDAFLFAGTSFVAGPELLAAKGIQIASKSKNIASWGSKGAQNFKTWLGKLKFVKTKGFSKSPPKPAVHDQKLKNIIDDLYKGQTNPNKVGSGTTADAIRYEKKTGQAVHGRDHTQKGEEYRRGLENWLKNNPDAPADEVEAAKNVLNDLSDALQGK